jgi:hypothetical protein
MIQQELQQPGCVEFPFPSILPYHCLVFLLLSFRFDWLRRDNQRFSRQAIGRRARVPDTHDDRTLSVQSNPRHHRRVMQIESQLMIKVGRHVGLDFL